MEKIEDVRCRFAPSVPNSGGEFLHIGHAATLSCAAKIAEDGNYPLDIRIDDPERKLGSVINATCLLDVMNLVCWLEIKVRQMYVTPSVSLDKIMQSARGDFSLYNSLTPWQVTSAYDDLVKYQTIIIRGNEFSEKDNPASIAKQNSFKFWGIEPYREINLPLLLLGGKKVAKSLGNAPHWSCLKKYDPEELKKYFWRMAQKGENYEVNWAFE